MATPSEIASTRCCSIGVLLTFETPQDVATVVRVRKSLQFWKTTVPSGRGTRYYTLRAPAVETDITHAKLLNRHSFSLKAQVAHRDPTSWLGREDLNLRMAESKSARFSFLIKRHSEKIAKFSPNSINRLGRVSECRRERFAAARPRYNSEMVAVRDGRSWKPNAAPGKPIGPAPRRRPWEAPP